MQIVSAHETEKRGYNYMLKYKITYTHLTENKNFILFLKVLLFLLLAYPPIFLHLDTLPIRIWDESRLAINAYEMHKYGNYLIPHFLGTPDMWNTKPPLMIWFQVFFIKLLGVNELSIRLPSAIAAFLTCCTLLWFSIRHIKNYWVGLIAVLILVTSHGYINFHASRTGDYDALLTLFTTLFCFSYFLFLETNSKKYLHLFFTALILAVLTKSIQGGFFLPALLIYTLIKRKFRSLIKSKMFWVDLIISITIIASYYLLREKYNPGYLQAVWDNELWGRYIQTNEGHKQDFWYYYHNLIAFQFSFWYWLIPCGITIGCTIKNKQIRNTTFFSTITGLIYLLTISLAQTKLEWYDAPLYPFLAIIGAVPIFWLFSIVKNSHYLTEQFKINTVPYAFLFFIFLTPYKIIIDKVYCPKEYDWDKEFYSLSAYLQDAVNEKHNVNNRFLCYSECNSHLLLYVNILNDNGKQVGFKDWRSLKPGNMIITSEPEVRNYIDKHYSYDIIESYYNIITYKIRESVTTNN